MCWDPFNEYVLSQFVKNQHCVKGSFVLYFGVVKSHNFSLVVAIYDSLLYLISANIRWDAALPT